MIFTKLIRSARFLIAAFVASLLFLSSALPALAAYPNSNPTQGIKSLNKVEQNSEEAIKSNPRSMEDVQAKASEGINGVQGGADKDKMSTPENSQDATSFKEVVEDALEGIQGK